ncbi:MAG: SLC13 family permease [Gammaproteobacteria bacterium]|nr:SLC13 family permease [Gammaproteobacteria bacterium]
MPPPPDPHAIFALVTTAVALFLFTRERLPLETSCLLVLVVLTVGFQLFPYGSLRPTQFFMGFGHEALVAICALMIVAKGLETTGALEPLATLMARRWSSHPMLSLLTVLVTCALLSAFLNNTPIVVMLLPILVSVSLRSQRPATGLLMPMGFATILGGMGTTIGTSTNLLVVGVAADLGQRRFEMFDFTLPAIFAASVGILYLWLIAPRLLPPRPTPLSDTSPRVFDALLYVGENSYANGRTLSEVLNKTDKKMKVARIQRGEDLFLVRLPTLKLRAGDRLYVSDTPENLKEYERRLGATLHNVFDMEHPIDEEHPLSAKGQQLAEVVVTEGSPLYNLTLRQAQFAERYNVMILAIHRAQPQATTTDRDLNDIVLQHGDVLLLQGPRDNVASLKNSGRVLVLDATVDLPHTRDAPIALGIMFLVVVSAAVGLAPISVSALCGVTLMLLSGCLTWRGAASALSTSVILVIVTSLALGVALTRTGGADYIAQLFVAAAQGLSPALVMSGLMLLLAVLTNVVSNNAAAVVGTPIAVSIAQQLDVSPEPFILAVLFGANMSYATPVGYQTNLLIFSTGGYRFSDFLRVGIPLLVTVWIAFSLLLPMFYGF